MKFTLQEIKLEGTFNFRDLGGYRTLDGRRVKQGMLYRSGNLSILEENGQKKIIELGIKRICDLRNIDEIEKFPDPLLDGVVWHHTPVQSDLQMQGHEGEHKDFADMLRGTKPGEMLLNLNQHMVSYKLAFQKVFEVLRTDPSQPLLFHCMAGKDRTGAVAALVLLVLGVPREVIVEDYLYTNETLEAAAAHFEEIGYNDLPNVDQAVLDALFEARAEYIQTFIDEMEAAFGNIGVYSKEVLGLSEEDVDFLKSYWLE